MKYKNETKTVDKKNPIYTLLFRKQKSRIFLVISVFPRTLVCLKILFCHVNVKLLLIYVGNQKLDLKNDNDFVELRICLQTRYEVHKGYKHYFITLNHLPTIPCPPIHSKKLQFTNKTKEPRFLFVYSKVKMGISVSFLHNVLLLSQPTPVSFMSDYFQLFYLFKISLVVC